jgi:hypothetical protein
MLAFSFIFSMVSQSVKYLKLLSPKIQHRAVRELADSVLQRCGDIMQHDGRLVDVIRSARHLIAHP